MMNIFSIFDPMTSMKYSWNWLIMLYIMMYLPQLYWVTPNRFIMNWNNIMMFIINELKIILFKKIFYLHFLVIFIMIMLMNFLGLFSYIFTASSHMMLTMSISLPMWLTFMIIGWIFNTNHMFKHQVPSGTPNMLMSFMVMIEFVSNLIRPLTLSVRLAANMIAGHLLLTLMSNNGPKMMMISMMMLIMSQSILMMLEMAVSMIQAYVFMILTALYSSEIN
uniref:ATP synthase subunit a n=1 Tax=Platygaster sp. ZJUH_2016029 TaxID=2496284 RepID=A0A3Q8UAA9_9HYME|nr:ATP synthase F0 subunit 6 [Platygaster sp. ZJUH_2016029]